MLLKLDENLPAPLVADLAALGHDAATCAQEGLGGAGDAVIAAHAAQEGRILATCDLDFADIRRFPPGSHPGIIVLRLQSQDVGNCRLAFLQLLRTVPVADFHGNLVIAEETRVRVRRP